MGLVPPHPWRRIRSSCSPLADRVMSAQDRLPGYVPAADLLPWASGFPLGVQG